MLRKNWVGWSGEVLATVGGYLMLDTPGVATWIGAGLIITAFATFVLTTKWR